MPPAGALLDIGEVSRASGISPSALRFYEDKGLVDSATRKGLRRQYRPDVLERLAVIIMCQRAGFSLAEIDAVLATRGENDWKDLVSRKLHETRAHIAALARTAEGLEHALGCPSPNVLRCTHFRAELARTLDEHRAAAGSGEPAGRRGRALSPA